MFCFRKQEKPYLEIDENTGEVRTDIKEGDIILVYKGSINDFKHTIYLIGVAERHNGEFKFIRVFKCHKFNNPLPTIKKRPPEQTIELASVHVRWIKEIDGVDCEDIETSKPFRQGGLIRVKDKYIGWIKNNKIKKFLLNARNSNDGKLRQAIKFKRKKSVALNPNSSNRSHNLRTIEELDAIDDKEAEEAINQYSAKEINQYIREQNRKKIVRPESVPTAVKRYGRDAKLSAALKCKYKKCQANDKSFRKEDGQDYLETHHLIFLGDEGGIDHPSNMVVLCPMCHKKLHHGAKQVRLRVLKNLLKGNISADVRKTVNNLIEDLENQRH